MVETITREEYQRLKKNEYAGTKASMIPEARVGWEGTHWMLTIGERGTTLVPINIAKSDK